MKKIIINDFAVATVILFSVFTLGLFVPMLTVFFLALTTKYVIFEMVITGQFWLFTVIGWILAAFYINDSVKKDPNEC